MVMTAEAAEMIATVMSRKDAGMPAATISKAGAIIGNLSTGNECM